MVSGIEVIAIGDELLNGSVTDTNSTWLGAQLCDLGLEVTGRQVVRDLVPEVSAALTAACRSRYVILSGGLGPTSDDRTAEACADFLGVPLERNDVALREIEAKRARYGRSLRKLDEKQAWLPKGATLLDNRIGIAPGFQFHSGGTRFFCLPGVPAEWRAMSQDHVLPALSESLEVGPRRCVWKFVGVTESGLAEYVDSLHTAGLELHYRAHFPEIHLTAVGSDSQTLDALDGHLRDRFSLKHFGGADAHFPAVVNDVLRKRNWTLATAESCTGGLISQLITSVAGSSDVFEYGAVTYGNTAKSVALGVPADLIATHGAVSQPVAEKMAMGARDRACADVGLAVTGIAGPGGGTEEKPVGTVHLAVASEDGITHRKLFYPYDRARIRLITAYTALLLVRKICMRGMIHGEKSEHSEGH